jgi:tetratricopeptide (TPR) repeat protein
VTVLVGRQRELVELEAALEDAERGHGALVLVRGEPGIGKTSLADVFGSRASVRGARVAWGRGWEVGGAPAYWPWIEVFRTLLAMETDAALPMSRLAELAQIDPELQAKLVDVALPAQLEPKQARFRLFDAASALLAHAGARAPLVVVLDDMHAADPATLEMLQFIARGIRRMRVVVIATYRDIEARARMEVSEILAALSRDGKTLALRRLDEAAVAEWLGQFGMAALGAVVYARSEGNPLFVVELLRLVEELGDAALSSIPDGVRDVIRRRLRSLEGAAREVLEVAAVCGRIVDLRIVARVIGRPIEALVEDLAGANAARVLVPGTTRDHLVFSHVLIQEVLYTEIATARRASVHGAIADVLLSHGDPLYAEIAHHLFAAIPARGSAAAIEAARRAAEHAISQFAFDDAIDLLSRALAEVPREAEHDVLRVDLSLELAEALFGAGRAAEGRTRANEALAMIRRLDDRERLARATLLIGSAPTFASVDAELVTLLESTLEAIPDEDSAMRARLLARLGAALQPAIDPEPPMQLARKGIAMSRRIGDAKTHLEVLHSATAALGYFSDPAERVKLNQELASTASRLGDKPRVLRAHLRLVFDYLEAGDAVQSDACIEVCARLAAQLGRPAYQWSIPLVRSMRAVNRGEWAASEAFVEEARAIAAQAGDLNTEMSFTLHRVGFLRASTRYEELAAFIPTAAPIMRRIFDQHYAEACVVGAYARVGSREGVRETLDRLGRRIGEMRNRPSVAWLAEGAALLDDAALAERVYALLEPCAFRNHAWGVMTKVCEGPLVGSLGLAAATARKFDLAASHFETALVRVEPLGALPHRARIETDYATMLLHRGAAGDRDRAARLLESARAIGDRIDLPGLVAAIDTIDLGAPESRPSAPSLVPTAPRFELRPEGDYWTIACNDAVFRLKDSRGLRILALLIASADREFHVVDLAAPPGEAGLADDAGDALDARAVGAYKTRIVELREELAEAESWSDQGRATRLREELDQLASELARGLGLGGRARKVSSSVERARVNVRKRVQDAIVKIGEHSALLAQHLEWAIKTGTFCAYHPTGRPRTR